MKYKKGTFVIVPNKERLRGKPSEYLAIFFWLCAYANDNGTCFPSRQKLAFDCGVTDRTIDKYVEMLVADGLIEKKKRKNKTTNEYTSNLYSILQFNGVAKRTTVPLVKTVTQPSEAGDPTGGEPNIPITVSNINYTNLTTPQPEVEQGTYSFEEEMQKLFNQGWKGNKIIWLYITWRKLRPTNQKQFDSEVGRNKQFVKNLTGYDSEQVEKTFEYCQEKWGEYWSLKAVVNNISLVASGKI